VLDWGIVFGMELGEVVVGWEVLGWEALLVFLFKCAEAWGRIRPPATPEKPLR
jgi:hypothetical protein